MSNTTIKTETESKSNPKLKQKSSMTHCWMKIQIDMSFSQFNTLKYGKCIKMLCQHSGQQKKSY